MRKIAHGYVIADDISEFNTVKSIFEKKAVASDELKLLEVGSVRPLFVVGMPRSGTTLVEQILSSHSEVHGAGELEILADLVRPIIRQKTEHPNFRIAHDQLIGIRQL